MNATLCQPDAIAELFRSEGPAAIRIVAAIADAVQEAGSVPSGHLYARLMGYMSVETFDSIISNIAATGLIRRDGNHLLVWTGPVLPSEQPQQQSTKTYIDMKVTIALGATTASIKTAHPVPRGSTHFRFTVKDRKPIIDKLIKLDTLAGCESKLEFGNAVFEGRGRHA